MGVIILQLKVYKCLTISSSQDQWQQQEEHQITLLHVPNVVPAVTVMRFGIFM